MVNVVCDHGIPSTVTCGHCLAAGRIVQLEAELAEAKQYLKECRGLLGHLLPAGMSDFLNPPPCIHKWIGLAKGGFRCTQCDAEIEDSPSSGGTEHGA